MKHIKHTLIALCCVAVAASLALAQGTAKQKVQSLRVKNVKAALGKMDAASKDKTRSAGEAFEAEDPEIGESAALEKGKQRSCFYCGAILMEVMGKSIYNPGKADDPRTKKRVNAYFKRLTRLFRTVGIAEETKPDLDDVIAAYQDNNIEALGAALDKLSGTIQDNLEEKLGQDAIWYFSLGYSAKGYKLAGQAKLYDMVSVIAPTPTDLLAATPSTIDDKVKNALTDLEPVAAKGEDEIGPKDYALLKTRSAIIIGSFTKKRIR